MVQAPGFQLQAELYVSCHYSLLYYASNYIIFHFFVYVEYTTDTFLLILWFAAENRVALQLNAAENSQSYPSSFIALVCPCF